MLKYITAKFEGVCAETGKQIKIGDRVLYNNLNKRVYASGSPTHIQYRKDHPPVRQKKQKPRYYNWQAYNDR